MVIRQNAGGHSLFELIITVGIAALVLSLGVPSFGKMLADHRLKIEVDAIFHAVHVARKESVVRRREVTLCPSRDGQNCTTGFDWSAGWIVFVNLDRDAPATRDADEPLLQRHSVSSHNQVAANRHSFSFRTTVLRATNGTFIFCDKARRASPRALIVSYTGRPRVSRIDRNGNPYICPDYVKLPDGF
jgi:type IV fimbrial biogenesis protein FimT